MHPVYRAAVRLHCRYLDAVTPAIVDGMPLPPAMLRFRVGETPDVNVFRTVGRDTLRAIHASLGRIGRNLHEFDSVLDFGCGCGRTLLWLAREMPQARLYGTDVDAEAIAWCRTHLPRVQFEMNQPVPPLPYADESFDLIYGISVLTHLDEEHQMQWLRDLRRVLKPGGLLLLSVHGESTWSGLDVMELSRLRSKGFLFKTSARLRGILPDWYHTSYHSKQYVIGAFATQFELVDYQELGMGYQDAVLLRRVKLPQSAASIPT